MIRINLLPYREELRKQRQRETLMMFGFAAIAAAGIAFLVHVALAAKVDRQQGRNQMLEQEIKVLEAQITEISSIKERTQALLERKRVVESLQSNRADAVHILDQMLRLPPDGVYLKSIKQEGDKIEITGYAQSQARVASLVTAIEESRWLEGAKLGEIKSTNVEKVKANEFNVTFRLEREKVEEPSKPGVAPAKAAKSS